MDLNGENSELDKSGININEKTLVNDSNNAGDIDETLTANESLSLVDESVENGISEENLHANVNADSDEPSSFFEVQLNNKADDIVDEIIDSASLSLRSSGDFSLLNHPVTSNKDEAAPNSSSSEANVDNKKEPEPEKEDEWLDILGKLTIVVTTVY